MLYPLSYGGSSAQGRPGYAPRLAVGRSDAACTAGIPPLDIPTSSGGN